MTLLTSLARTAAATLLLSSCVLAGPEGITPTKWRKRQFAAYEAYINGQETFDMGDQLDVVATSSQRPANFSRAQKFYVDGTSIPYVSWDVGPSYAGLLPISGDPDETKKLFFWFFPAQNQSGANDLIFWTNGGPGCSSLEGLLQENGPFLWNYGTAHPEKNNYSWNKLANVIWVEQPVGVGFTEGTPNITNEHELAQQAVGFMQQFLDVFHELKGSNFWVAGESYAGKYVPHIANHLYLRPDALDVKTKGIWLNDPQIARWNTQSEVPVYSFLEKWNNVINLDSETMARLKKLSSDCGYTQNLKEYLTYPPKGPIPMPASWHNDTCDIWDDAVNAALNVNPAFNIYHIHDTPPILWDVLGYPGTSANVQKRPLYFNIPEVKKVIHAPNKTWHECNNGVFPTGDHSPNSDFSVMPHVIESSERVVIAHGNVDMIFIEEGCRLALQNLTWAGKQGFQKAPVPESFVVEGQGAMGTVQSERGLTYVSVDLAGHMVPQYQPKAAFKLLRYLLGQIDLEVLSSSSS